MNSERNLAEVVMKNEERRQRIRFESFRAKMRKIARTRRYPNNHAPARGGRGNGHE